MSQNIDKYMAYIMNESGGDFKQYGCLYKPTNGIQWTPKLSWTSDMPQKQASEKTDQLSFGSGVVIISQLTDGAIDWKLKTFFVIVCVVMWRVLVNPVT